MFDRQLAGNDGRTVRGAIIDDFQQIRAGVPSRSPMPQSSSTSTSVLASSLAECATAVADAKLFGKARYSLIEGRATAPVVVKAYPVANDTAGMLYGFEAVAVGTLLFKRSDHSLDHAILLWAVGCYPMSTILAGHVRPKSVVTLIRNTHNPISAFELSGYRTGEHHPQSRKWIITAECTAYRQIQKLFELPARAGFHLRRVGAHRQTPIHNRQEAPSRPS